MSRAAPWIAAPRIAAAIAVPRIAAAILAAARAGAPGGAAAGPPPGALSCAGCHAPPGIAGPGPELTDRTAAAIVADMQAFRAGTRDATVMDRIARGFSDEETRAIAEWLTAAGDRTAQPARPEPKAQPAAQP